VEHATTYPNERIYFFHRDAITQWIKPVHERVELRGNVPTKHFQGPSLAPLGNLSDYTEKANRYLQIERERSRGKGWGHWLRHRLYHTFRSRTYAIVKLLWIWLIPRKGKRLPLSQELIRIWYGVKLVVITCPLFRLK
jgi:hypothetical protein